MSGHYDPAAVRRLAFTSIRLVFTRQMFTRTCQGGVVGLRGVYHGLPSTPLSLDCVGMP